MRSDRVLYLLGSAAPPVFDVRPVIGQAQAAGWDVCLGLTSTAADWLAGDLAELEELTGHPIRHRHRTPEEADPWPPATVALIAPATFNTINSWALGLTSEWVVAFASEAVGRGLPLVMMPCVNTGLTGHPQFDRSIGTLRGAGVRVLLGEGAFVPDAPKQSDRTTYPWSAALAAVAEAAGW
ncbi:flavoprotein [Kitasatospora kazusensis]|uniref:Flavoprotein n=1 Tax=Kitasatospora kazusensis TaxID=407974 RepID=A0ABN2ZNQ2_9ACTN